MKQSPPAGRDEVQLLARLPPLQEDPDFGTSRGQKEYATVLEAEGVRDAVWMYEPAVISTVQALHDEIGLRVHPMVPNMRAYLRDASEHGVVGAALQRYHRLVVADKLRVATHHLGRVFKAARRDFPTGVLIMADMELVHFRRFGASMAFLNASVTDLVLAMDDPRLIREFLRLTQRTYGLEGGLATYNLGVLAERLQAWKIRPAVIAAPFNARGYLMNPSIEQCERALDLLQASVLATHIEVDGLVQRQEAIDYLRGHGIRRAVARVAA